MGTSTSRLFRRFDFKKLCTSVTRGFQCLFYQFVSYFCFKKKTAEDIISSSKPEMVETTTRTFLLNDGEHLESSVFKLKKGWWVELRLGPTLFGRKVTVYTNLPEEGKPFSRKQYRALTWSTSSSDDTAKYCRLHLTAPGSYHYYFHYDDSDTKRGSGYILVEPTLSAGGEEVTLDCLQCVTYIAKLLGPFDTWESKLRVAKETGYNMIHFTPIQELGASNSAYSLQNQLGLNPSFAVNGHTPDIQEVEQLTNRLRNEWKMLTICDIVLNHTANESPWLREHPECTYNLVNCPHLKPAYLLDLTLYKFSLEVAKGMWEFSGVPPAVNSEEHLQAIRHALFGTILPRVRISELYLLNVHAIVDEFQRLARNRVPPLPTSNPPDYSQLKLVPDPQFRRLHATVDLELALRLFNVYRSDSFDEDTRLRRCTEEFKRKLEELNEAVNHKIQGHLVAAVENCVAGMRYFRVQGDGPRIPEVTAKDPLVPRYFTDADESLSEDVMYSSNACYVMAHNGWVMNADPLANFASPESNIYLRRELIAWGDSVKLRYGEKPEDCPFLWQHMQAYVDQMAQTFDGIRLDNCHSTPLVVAEYLLDSARRVRPNLFVAAELFTNSDQTDNIFVNRLGITSLIREAMSAWDSHELGRLVYRYGGVPVGAFLPRPDRPLAGGVAHALFLDLTHDNPCPLDKRSVFDSLPSAALVAMACCASGSNMGYDMLVPHHIHVVDESREYMPWADDAVNINTGIIAGKRALNNLHYQLGKNGFDQVFVDQVTEDVVCVTRHSATSRETVVLVAFTAFQHPHSDKNVVGRGVTVSGNVDYIILEASLAHSSADKFSRPTQFEKDPKKINGLTEYELSLRENLKPSETTMLEIIPSSDGGTRLNFTNKFKPGCVVAVKVVPQPQVRPALQKLSQVPDMQHVVASLTLADCNRVLFKCDKEDAAYDIPGFGPLVYCGLQGIVSLLAEISPKNDLGHPLCGNLRGGMWLCDYTVGRLQLDPGTRQLGDWLQVRLAPLADVPHFLRPSYFDLVITQVYDAVVDHTYQLMNRFVSDGSSFVKALALGSVQCGGVQADAPLPPLSAALAPPLPPTRTLPGGETKQACVTLSAGLPHFAQGYMRNWGRDTFIALPGLFLLTGRYDEARFIILAYAGCLRHGLIPNLLDGGVNARFNCRDAVWWWLYSIQCYVHSVPSGTNILRDTVNRIYPHDDSEPTFVDQPLYDVIQEAMQVHFQGLCFRERNAGTKIDAHMTNQGFNVQIGVHPKTGFVFGGNEWNCGTWMDKMGSSDAAGTRGKPATPRDGSAVELVGLCKAAVRFLAQMYREGHFPHSGVTRNNKDGSQTSWRYEEWDARIANNFESQFWVPSAPTASEERPDLVNRRGIYKDSVGATQPWTDYQLRPNFPIAMVVAPELFLTSNAWQALKVAEEHLLGPLGMKTLDPSDWAYYGDYNNDNQSSDPKVAHGYNYHQGPEWVWPIGFFLRARLHFAELQGGAGCLARTIAHTHAILARHYSYLQNSPWRGLPELTNSNGTFCAGSCATQAWSMSCVLEVLEKLQSLERSLGDHGN
uniref:Glycogen debranching enzyme n=1 Tax=Cuerna arida TaxID=1464854 RepID=A0A1B6F753_9HEMI